MVAQILRAIFTDGYLNALLCEALAQWGALDDARELFSRVNGKRVREAGGKNWTFASRYNGVGTLTSTDVAHAQL